jgi:outer membrane protein assembly factor BamB
MISAMPPILRSQKLYIAPNKPMKQTLRMALRESESEFATKMKRRDFLGCSIAGLAFQSGCLGKTILGGRRIEWEVETAGQIGSSLILSSGTLFGMSGTEVLEIDPVSGDVLWRFAGDRSLLHGFAIGDQLVYAGGVDGEVLAVPHRSEETEWVTQTVDGYPVGGLAHTPNSDTIHATNLRGSLLSINSSTGERDWTYDVNNVIIGDPLAGGNVIYVSSEDGFVHAVETSGNRLWRSRAGTWITATPTLNEDSLYVGTHDGIVHAFDSQTGRQNWQYETGEMAASPVVEENVAYIASAAGRAIAVDVDSNEELWEFDGFLGTFVQPRVTRDRVYISGEQKVLCLRRDSGQLAWSVQVDSPAHTPVLGQDRVYVGSTDGTIYAISR